MLKEAIGLIPELWKGITGQEALRQKFQDLKDDLTKKTDDVKIVVSEIDKKVGGLSESVSEIKGMVTVILNGNGCAKTHTHHRRKKVDVACSTKGGRGRGRVLGGNGTSPQNYRDRKTAPNRCGGNF